MSKEFLTEKDIEDMFKRGVMSLEVNDNIVLTELAYEKANRLGMKLVQQSPDKPPSAPVRPYMSQKQSQPPRSTPSIPTMPVPSMDATRVTAARAEAAKPTDGQDLHQRIRNAVIARLGNQVDSNLLDVIIKRVLNSTGVK